MNDYIVLHTNGNETKITGVYSVKQVFGFVEFRASSNWSNRPDPLIVAINKDHIFSYGPINASKPEASPTVTKVIRRSR